MSWNIFKRKQPTTPRFTTKKVTGKGGVLYPKRHTATMKDGQVYVVDDEVETVRYRHGSACPFTGKSDPIYPGAPMLYLMTTSSYIESAKDRSHLTEGFVRLGKFDLNVSEIVSIKSEELEELKVEWNRIYDVVVPIEEEI